MISGKLTSVAISIVKFHAGTDRKVTFGLLATSAQTANKIRLNIS